MEIQGRQQIRDRCLENLKKSIDELRRRIAAHTRQKTCHSGLQVQITASEVHSCIEECARIGSEIDSSTLLSVEKLMSLAADKLVKHKIKVSKSLNQADWTERLTVTYPQEITRKKEHIRLLRLRGPHLFKRNGIRLE
jgi:hypothetical protein